MNLSKKRNENSDAYSQQPGGPEAEPPQLGHHQGSEAQEGRVGGQRAQVGGPRGQGLGRRLGIHKLKKHSWFVGIKLKHSHI